MTEKINSQKIVYYFALTALHFIIHFWSHNLYDIPILRRLLYLTNISLYLNTVYYASMLLVHTKLINFHRHFELSYFKFCYVISFVVFTLYWAMMLLDPKLLIKDKTLQSPVVLDLLLHGANFILNLVEIKFINPRENYDINYFFYVGFCIVYGAILKIALNVFEWAVYPFVHSASHVEYVVILSCALGLVLVGDVSYCLITNTHQHHADHQHNEHHHHHTHHQEQYQRNHNLNEHIKNTKVN
jgi:hypothetical protein